MSQILTDKQIAIKLTRYKAIMHSCFKPLISSGDMPLSMYRTLEILNEHGQMRMGEIATKIEISRPNLTPIIDNLVNLNYIERVSCGQDRRVIEVRIKEEGKAALTKEDEMIADRFKLFSADITEEEREKLMSSLETITNMFKLIE